MTRGAYVDNRGITWDTNATDYEGWIGKRSKWLGEWRNRYFLLIGSRLFYAKDERTTPHGMIELIDCISATAGKNTNEKGYIIEIKLKTTSLNLSTESAKDQCEWLEDINKSLISNSAMHLYDQS
jgi:hypothetical protein